MAAELKMQPQPVAALELLDSLVTSVFLLDRELHVTYLNAAAQTLLGLSPNQVLGRRITDAVRGAESLLPLFERARQGGEGVVQRELPWPASGGVDRILDCAVTEVALGGGRQAEGRQNIVDGKHRHRLPGSRTNLHRRRIGAGVAVGGGRSQAELDCRLDLEWGTGAGPDSDDDVVHAHGSRARCLHDRGNRDRCQHRRIEVRGGRHFQHHASESAVAAAQVAGSPGAAAAAPWST